MQGQGQAAASDARQSGRNNRKQMFSRENSNPGRLTASELSVKNPELINAGLTSTAKRTTAPIGAEMGGNAAAQRVQIPTHDRRDSGAFPGSRTFHARITRIQTRLW